MGLKEGSPSPQTPLRAQAGAPPAPAPPVDVASPEMMPPEEESPAGDRDGGLVLLHGPRSGSTRKVRMGRAGPISLSPSIGMAGPHGWGHRHIQLGLEILLLPLKQP